MHTWILWNTKCRKKACSCDSAKGKSGGQRQPPKPALKCLRFVLVRDGDRHSVPRVAASNHLRLAEVKGDNVVCSLPVPSTALHL